MASGDVHLKRVWDVPGRITDRGLSSSNATLVGPPAVAVALAGQGKTRGTAALVNIKLCTNQSIALIKGRDAVLDTRFLFHNLDSRYEELRARSSGGGRAGLSRLILDEIPILLPPVAEQRRIAEILDTIDEAIRETEQVIAKLQQIKQGLLRDLLTWGIDENGELRDPERHPDQFQDTLLGRIPHKWETAPFASFASKSRPFLKTGPFGSSLKGEHWVDRGIPVITIGALGEGEFIESELLFVSDKTAKRLSAYAVVPGEVVFSRVADVGRSVVVPESSSGWIMSSNLMWISLDLDRVEPNYVQLTLSHSSEARGQVRRFVNAGGREVANAAVLKSLRLAWPDREEQEGIVRVALGIVGRVRAERASLDKLVKIKAALSEDLLTGRVRVKLLGEDAA
jgi:type I restriction enzyme S subunit